MSAGPRPADLADAACTCGPQKPTGACPVCLRWAELGQRLSARCAWLTPAGPAVAALVAAATARGCA